MYVLDVIPLSRSAPGSLSYRSKENLAPGTVVDVELRKTRIRGIVISSEHVQDVKAMLKGVHYTLKQSTSTKTGIFPVEAFAAARSMALRHASSIGSVLATLFGEFIRNDVEIPVEAYARTEIGFEELFSEEDIWARSVTYRKLINDVRSRGESVLLVVPTLAEITFWKRVFKDEKPLVLSGALSGVRRKDALTRAVTHAGLILATPSFSWVPVVTLGAYIIERVSAGTYVFPKRPYLDMVYATRELARARNVPCMLGDFPIPLEYRSLPEVPLDTGAEKLPIVVDARASDDPALRTDGPWKVLPDPVLDRIRGALAERGRVFVLAARTGYAPAVVCRDCGQSVVDSEGRPLSYGTVHSERTLRTSTGVAMPESGVACARCGSWNLLPLGVGQERVAEELIEHFPDAHIVHATTDMLARTKTLRTIRDDLRQPGTIIVGTESLLPWILESLDMDTLLSLAVIASADSLLALPFWRARERFVRLGLLMNSLANETHIVTRRPDDTAVRAVQGDSSFFAEETALRKALAYPPFGTLITLRVEASIKEMLRVEEYINEYLSELSFSITSESTKSSTTTIRTYAAIVHGTNLDPELAERLAALPLFVRVRIDPESIW